MTVPRTAGRVATLDEPARAAHTRLAYEALKERIASGAVPPGEWLREYTVATSLGLSRTPVPDEPVSASVRPSTSYAT